MTDVITFSGRYAVVEFLPSPHVYDTYTCRGDKNGFSAQIKFSKKIKKSGLTKLLGSIAESCLYSFAADLRSLGYLMEIIVRTEAETLCKDGFITDDDQFKNEIEKFFELFKTIQSRFEERRTDRGISRLYSVGFFEYINRVYRISSFDSVITSEPCFVGMVKSDAPWLNEKINLLRESSSGYDIFTLINASRKLPSLLGKRIYLKCGGEIIIERTEAMSVIDINSSSASLSYYDVNAEAAVEIMRQLQLRNIGGIIMCDFINMVKMKMKSLKICFESLPARIMPSVPYTASPDLG